MRRTGWWLFLGIGAAAVAGLGFWVLRDLAPPTPAPVGPDRLRPQGGTYSMAVAEPAHLNPLTTVELVVRRGVLAYTHDTLMSNDPDTGGLRPALATAMTVDPTGRVLTFDLRPEARFSDSAPVTMADVLALHEFAASDGLVPGTLAAVTKDVEAMRSVGPRRLEVVLRSPRFGAVERFATGYFVIQRSFFVREVERRALAAGRPVPAPGTAAFGKLLQTVEMPGPGTGPYRVAQWQRGMSLDLVAHPNAWHRRERPDAWNLARLRYRFLADRAAQFAALRQGELDLLVDPDAEGLLEGHPELAADFRAVTYDHRGLGLYVVIWNHARPRLREAKVRRALSRLFDRQAIVRTVFGGRARVAMDWRRPPEGATTASRFDPGAARRELAAAKFEEAPLELLIAAGNTVQRRIAELAVPAFRRAGVQLVPKTMSWTALLARLQAREFDAVLVYDSLRHPLDPHRRFHSSEHAAGNHSGYASSAMDAVLDGLRGARDAAEFEPWLAKFHARFAADEPVTVLTYPLSTVLLRRTLRAVKPSVLGLSPERWWLARR